MKSLKLDMKISDVEYQADGKKITFYYTAKQRIDFRNLIKILAQQFKSRIQMFQKADIFSRKLFYSLENKSNNLIELDIKRVHDIIAKNKENKKVDILSLAMKKKNKENNIQFEFHDKIDRFDNIKN